MGSNENSIILKKKKKLSLSLSISIWAQTHLEEQEQTPFSYHCHFGMCAYVYPSVIQKFPPKN